jgi:hypothetical protein
VSGAPDTFAFDAVSAELCGALLDEGVQHRAALTVCGQARDVDDARELLLTLGLVSVPPRQRRSTDRRRPREDRSSWFPISASLAAELRTAHEAEVRGRPTRRLRRDKPPARRAPWPVALPDARAVAAGMHGHMVGLHRHLEAGEPLCPSCRACFDDMVASGCLRQVAS